MKRFLSFLSIAAVSLSTLAQVTIPFDVPMPKWKKLVTPNSSGQLFRNRILLQIFLFVLKVLSMTHMNGINNLTSH